MRLFALADAQKLAIVIFVEGNWARLIHIAAREVIHLQKTMNNTYSFLILKESSPTYGTRGAVIEYPSEYAASVKTVATG